MSFLTDFPNAVEYQRDLGYLIEQFKELDSKYADYGERISAIENQISSLPAYVQTLVYEQTQQLQRTIERELSDMQKKIDANVATVQEVRELVAVLQQQFLELARNLVDMMHFVELYTDKIGNEVYERLKMLVDEWTNNLPPVTCPVDGNLETINVALYHVYNSLRRGMTAGDFDALLLTAKGYDAMRIHALEYDIAGQDEFAVRKNWYMVSPFDGEYVSIESVVQKLADLHKLGITASVYDGKELHAVEYDAEDITAYNYDWNNPLRG